MDNDENQNKSSSVSPNVDVDNSGYSNQISMISENIDNETVDSSMAEQEVLNKLSPSQEKDKTLETKLNESENVEKTLNKSEKNVQTSKRSFQLEYIQRTILRALWKHPQSWPFRSPVDPIRDNAKVANSDY